MTGVQTCALPISLRIVKHPDEIEILRRAGAAADRVVDAIAAGKLVGRTEADVSREVYDRLQAEGHQTPTFGIVASGPNACILHYHENRRRLEDGDLVLIDAGGEIGFRSGDITRTFPANGRFTPARWNSSSMISWCTGSAPSPHGTGQ